MMIAKVKRALGTLKDDKLYSPDDIQKLGVIVNTKLEPSLFTVYRLIRSGKLPAVNIGTGGASRHFIKGAALKAYLKSTYKL